MTAEITQLNGSTYLDWLIDVYVNEVGGDRDEIAFLLIPGHAMDVIGEGKDPAHADEIIPAAIQMSNDYHQCSCYNLRAVFPETVMTANNYYNTVSDSDHLSTLGYNDLAAKLVLDVKDTSIFA